jgi:hypothetical protein
MLIKLGPQKDVWSAMKIIHRLFGNCFLALVCTTLFCVRTAAATPSVHKVVEHTELKPLEMLTGGRTVRTSSASISAFGGNEYTSQWPGSYFRVAFNGATVFFRVGKNEEILHTVADHLAAMALVRPEPGLYEIQALGTGAHEVSIFIDSERSSSLTKALETPLEQLIVPRLFPRFRFLFPRTRPEPFDSGSCSDISIKLRMRRKPLMAQRRAGMLAARYRNGQNVSPKHNAR